MMDDKKVIDLFLDKKPGESRKLTSDGTRLDGNWMGGNKLAVWVNGKIQMNDLGSKIADSYQKMIRKAAPKNWLAESCAMKMSELIDLLEGELIQEGYGYGGMSYPRDPYWLVAKYAGTDKNGKPFKKGEKVFYYPSTKSFLTGAEAEKASKEFESAKADEYMMSMGR